MLSYITQQLLYPKAVVLILTALLVFVWAGYFCSTLAKKHGAQSLKQYVYYVTYTLGLFVWILSNAYFHSGWLVEWGPNVGATMAVVANLSALLAFSSAYYFSAKLKKHYTSSRPSSWQLLLAGLTMIFCTIINIVPDLTIKGVVIEGPSQFMLEFGEYTRPFFIGLTLLFALTFLNLLSIKRCSSRVRRTRINYMILGMTIFMASTAVIQLGFTYFFNNFSLTWLPPALSISEMLFMGYAILASRFYSFRYLCLVGCSLIVTAAVYTFVVTLFKPLDYVSTATGVLAIMAIGLSWPYTSRLVRTCLTYALYGSPVSPTEKIAQLEDEFQKSPSQAIEALASYLGVPSDKLKLLDDYQGASMYRSYFENHTTPLVIDEIEDAIEKNRNKELSTIHSSMNQMESALVLPIYEGKNKLSHVLVSSHKQGDVNFSFEELKALERVIQKVQVHINYEQKVRQSQALANSIAHEMRNPLAQVQFEFESLNQKLLSPVDSNTLLQHVDKGKQAIKRGRQLIDIILREVNSSSLDQEPSEATLIHGAINSAINQYGFDNDSELNRIVLDLDEDFVAKINDTLFNFVLFNLLRNAIYYFDSYPNSHIEIRTEQGQYENYVLFRDTGPGIPAELLTRIFDDFFSHNKSGGSGLGLGYCQRVMASFGGSISCHSEVGSFTEFKLTFPATNVAATQANKPKTELRSEVTTPPLAVSNGELNFGVSPAHMILVVDDKEIQRTLVKLYLEQLGYGVVLANNGKVAIEIIQNNPIDLVFMDIQMPVMNGFEAASIIKRSFPTIPIIALSGESGERELTMISELMDGRLSKPTTKEALDQMLKSALPMSIH
ncbi:hybrid sensor histidine kinase/response regulator [Vibrio europaeus]|uniref:histidine kinase n=1 Tax=Vibrio europaeus TaxID=300876 RepID=A0A178JD00_9VIBR|nr:response regulator [Vibrio europaeus]MDC5707562.1 response regulator [Vibrio europaeus]MDC5709808.1 response regulator [Vibrio europaeus]MDC5716715.1 response regulator [Vibrio europaeus]MDC5722664.1 response regulator [Vibrio europaeus]MDC5727035.1 response regulator [Vibrio europaeus]